MRFRLKIREVEAVQWNKPGDAAIVQDRRCKVTYKPENGKSQDILVGNSVDNVLEQMRAVVEKCKNGFFEVVDEEGESLDLTLPTEELEDGTFGIPENKIYKWVAEVFSQPKRFVVNTGKEIVNVHPGDWIIKDNDNHLAVMTDSDFKAAFDPI